MAKSKKKVVSIKYSVISRKTALRVTFFSLLFVTCSLLLYLGFLFFYQNKFYPGVKIAGQSIAGQSPTSSSQLLATEFRSRASAPLELELDQSFQINLASTSPQINLSQTINQAYLYGRSGETLKDLQDQFLALIQGKNFDPEVIFQDPNSLTTQITQINNILKKDPIEAKINPTTLEISPSSDGMELDQDGLRQKITDYLRLKSISPKYLNAKTKPANFTTIKAQRAINILKLLTDKPLILRYGQKTWNIDQIRFISLINTKGGDDLLDKDKLQTFLEEVSSQIYQPTQNARFNINKSINPPRVIEFQAAVNGQELNIDQTKSLILTNLASGTIQDIELPVKVTRATVTTEETNNFGITELLAQGVSHFAGSIPNRIYNVGLAASRINGVLVAPGEVFSFDNTIGDVSAATGYKQAYVIKSGRTVLDDGGGVCQVSTTLFRSVLNAGLPVVARTAHAYRVGYYEQGFPPGLDATIFYPSVDFKFKNDTGSYILIQAYTSGTTLYIDLYGRSDGRSVVLTTPKISNQTPPPPELRQDDPTLPKGTVKQVDFAAWGATVSFSRTVTRGGQTIIQENFTSNYKPWQAVYLVGTM